MSQITWDFNGRKALVTGGTRGIGKQIVTKLVEAGAQVIFTYNSNHLIAEQLVHDLGAQNVVAHKCDFESLGDLENLIDTIRNSDFKKLDYLVNNVGTTKDAYLHKMTFEDWNYVLQVNLNSVFHLTKQLLLPLAYSKGAIVNVTSITGITGRVGQSNYAASKAGLIAFTKTIAKEMGNLGIRVNAIAPGFINTDMTNAIPAKMIAESKQSISLGRYGNPEEVAQTILFLLSDASSYTTGQVYVVDGGII